MKTESLKIPFIASLIFHSMALFTIASLLPSMREAVMDITPIEILQIEPVVEEKPEDIPEPLPEKEMQKIKKEIIEEPKINKVVEAPPLPAPIEKEIIDIPKPLPEKEIQKIKVVEAPPLPAPIEKEIIKEAEAESHPPLIEEALEKPSEETIFAESTALSSDNKADISETMSLRGDHQLVSGEAISTEPTKSTGSKYGVAGGTGSANGEEMSLFRAMVRTKIERAKFYPRWARERGFEGVVGVRFTVTPAGTVEDVKVIRPCHCEILNKAACDAIMKAAPFHPKPKELEAKKMPMEIDISYRLD